MSIRRKVPRCLRCNAPLKRAGKGWDMNCKCWKVKP